MTVQNTPNFVDYVGNDVQTSFPFTFRVDDVAWLSVDFTDNFSQFLLNADQETSPGGSVEYTVAPPSPPIGPDPSFRVTRTTPQAQLLDYGRYDAFDSESHEGALDRLTMQIQDTQTGYAVADAALQAQITANNLLITTGLSPGHQHVIADIVDAVNLLPSSTVEGSIARWDVGANAYVPTEALFGFIDNSMFITEQAAALASGAGRGQLWVKDDSPNVLMFTDDLGTDFSLGNFMLPLVLLDNEEIQFGTGTDVRMRFTGVDFEFLNDAAVGTFLFGAGPNFYQFDENVDMAGNDLSLTAGGFIQIFNLANTDTVQLQHNGTDFAIRQFIGTTNGVRFEDLNIYIEESAAATADITAYGQVWVRSDAPNTLMFTDDTGVDYVIGGLLFVGGYFQQSATGRVIGVDAGSANIADDVIIGGRAAADLMADADFAGSIVLGALAWSRATGTAAAQPSLVIGDSAMLNNTSAASGHNVVLGPGAAESSVADNTNPMSRNVVVGAQAGQQAADNSFSNATLVGYRAGRCNTANGFVNPNGATYIGALCGQNQQSGANNTGVGNDAMGQGAITGNENTAVGQSAMTNLAGGARNTAMGQGAALGLTGGDDNVYFGEGAGGTGAPGDGNTVIGQGAEGAVNQSNQICIGRRAGLSATLPASGFNFALEAAPGTGIHVLSFLYGELDVGNLVLGTAQSGPGAPINRDFGGGTPTNVFKIHDTTAAPTSVATAGATMFSESGSINFLTAGMLVIRSDGNTDTEARRVQLSHANGALRGELGHTSSSTLAIINRIHDGNVQIFGEETGGAARNMLIADPGAGVSLYNCLANEEAFRTSDRTAADQCSGAEVLDGNGTFRSVGFNILPRQTETGAYTFTQGDIGQLIYKGASASNTYTTPASTDTDVPVGAMWQHINNSGNTQTIAAGAGTSLNYLDGAGGATGSRTIADGAIISLWKFDDTTYFIWGNGIT